MSLTYPITLNAITQHQLAFPFGGVCEIENNSRYYVYVAIGAFASGGDVISQNVAVIPPFQKRAFKANIRQQTPRISFVGTNQPFQFQGTIAGSQDIIRISEYGDPKDYLAHEASFEGIAADYIVIAGGRVQANQFGLFVQDVFNRPAFALLGDSFTWDGTLVNQGDLVLGPFFSLNQGAYWNALTQILSLKGSLNILDSAAVAALAVAAGGQLWDGKALHRGDVMVGPYASANKGIFWDANNQALTLKGSLLIFDALALAAFAVAASDQTWDGHAIHRGDLTVGPYFSADKGIYWDALNQVLTIKGNVDIQGGAALDVRAVAGQWIVLDAARLQTSGAYLTLNNGVARTIDDGTYLVAPATPFIHAYIDGTLAGLIFSNSPISPLTTQRCLGFFLINAAPEKGSLVLFNGANLSGSGVLQVAKLSALSADLGSITAGLVTGATIRTDAGTIPNAQLDANGLQILADGTGWIKWLDSLGVLAAHLSATSGAGGITMRSNPARSLSVGNTFVQSFGPAALSSTELNLTNDGANDAATLAVKKSSSDQMKLILTRLTGIAELRSNPAAAFIGLILGGSLRTPAEILDVGGGAFFTGDVYNSAYADYSGVSTIVGWSAFSAKTIHVKSVGKLVYAWFAIVGTSNSVATSFTLPYALAAAPASVQSIIRAADNGGASAPGLSLLSAGSNVLTLYASLDGAAWTAGGQKIVAGQFCYQRA